MKKLKIYLDSSIFSHLSAQDTPEKMADTLMLWEDLLKDKYEIVISDAVVKEIDECEEPKRSFMFAQIEKIPVKLVYIDQAGEELAQEFINLGILKKKNLTDCKHISVALLTKCDIIVSWNFKHIVNDKTIEGVKTIEKIKGFNGIKIYCPSILIGGEND